MADSSSRGRSTSLVGLVQGRFPRRKLFWGVGLAWLATFGLLFWSLRSVPLPQIWQVLARLDLWQLAALLVVNLVILCLLAGRWGILLKAFGHPLRLGNLFRMRLTGFSVSYFTPGPQFGGETVQVDLLRRNDVPLSAAISGVFLDRMIDLLANFTFLLIGITTALASGVFTGDTGSQPEIGWLLPPVILIAPLFHLAALWKGYLPLTWLLARLTRGTHRQAFITVVQVVRQSEEQISLLCRRQPRVLLRVSALSAFTWLLVVMEYHLTLYFLGVQATLVQSVSALTAARLAFLMPLPGALGALEASQVFASQALGWGAAVGVALSLIIRSRDVLLAALGLVFGGFAYRKVLLNQVAYQERSS